MGGGTKVESAPAPAQPSTADAVNAWVQSMPKVYETQMQYAPLQAQQEMELAQKYAGPLAQTYMEAQRTMYPETVDLQERLATQAREGMSSEVPDWMKQQYQSNVNAQLGTNAYSPIGADYMSRGLMQQQQDWKQYYENLGLSATGRQPLTQAVAPQTTDYMSGFSPGATMNFMGQNYGTAANIMGTQQGMFNTAAGGASNKQGAMIGAGGAVVGGIIMAI